MSFDYYIPTKILFGAGKLNQLAEEKLPGKKAENIKAYIEAGQP